MSTIPEDEEGFATFVELSERLRISRQAVEKTYYLALRKLIDRLTKRGIPAEEAITAWVHSERLRLAHAAIDLPHSIPGVS